MPDSGGFTGSAAHEGRYSRSNSQGHVTAVTAVTTGTQSQPDTHGVCLGVVGPARVT